MQVRGASALVTGAARGIGHPVALALGRAGARVTLVARSASAIQSVAPGGRPARAPLAACLGLEVRQQGGKVTTIAPGPGDAGFGGAPRGDTSWMLTAEDVARAVMDLLEARDGAHLSRVEMRPARPQKRV